VANEADEERIPPSAASHDAELILGAHRRVEDELAHTREALRVSEERLRAIFQQAAVGIAVVSLDGYFVEVNPRFSDLLGYSPDELRRLTFVDVTHDDDLAITVESVRQLRSGAISDYSIEKRFVREDGTAIWALTAVTLIKDETGQPLSFLGVIEDITARKHAEAALHDETRMLELLNHTARMLSATLDTEALIQAVTDAATEISGAAFGAYVIHTPDDAEASFRLHAVSGAPPEGLAAFVVPRVTALSERGFHGAAAVRSGDVLTEAREELAARPDGALTGKVRSCLVVPVRSRADRVIGAMVLGHPAPHRFTERSERLGAGVAAQARMALDNARLHEAAQQSADEREDLLESERAARNAAERLSEMKDEFLATLSHELRTPLNAILGWAHVLRSGTIDESDLQKGLDTIERNARAQTQLIGDLLDMSRIASGKVRLELQTIQPVSFIEAALEAVRPAADAKGVRLETVLEDSRPITGDPGRLQQVIWNLLSNAIKFTPKGGTVQVRLRRVNTHIEVSVADTGIGIKEELIPHLFERFRQADASTTRQYGGLGLGLSIVRSLVELHGGCVSVKSPGEGLGTTITVLLPLTVTPPGTGERTPPRTRPSSLSRFATMDLGGLTVLVVDDQPDALDLIRRVLEACDARVLTCGTAAEALRLVAAERPDVLVSDIGMPGTDGFDLLRRVRALGAEKGGLLPAIALTAFARAEDRIRTLRSGFQVHVTKPVDPSELVATVASVAGR
jgi:PAS domain S-box-containing protein